MQRWRCSSSPRWKLVAATAAGCLALWFGGHGSKSAVSVTNQHIQRARAHKVVCCNYTGMRVILNENAFAEVAGHASSSVSMREHVCEPGTLPGDPVGSVCTRCLQEILQTLAVPSLRYFHCCISNAGSDLCPGALLFRRVEGTEVTGAHNQ